jgi:hypothetical protein
MLCYNLLNNYFLMVVKNLMGGAGGKVSGREGGNMKAIAIKE